MRNNDMVLLGLLPHGLDSEEVVERTVVLSQQEWQDACGDALGEEEIWGWELRTVQRQGILKPYHQP